MDELGHEERSERRELYRLAVEEYRFQVQLNWDRAKYFLGFNTAVIAAATGLFKVGATADGLVVGLFVVGLVSALLSAGIMRVQHDYYRSARDAMLREAAALGLGERSLTTTPGAQRSRTTRVARLTRVQNFFYAVLLVCATVDGLGVVLVVIGP